MGSESVDEFIGGYRMHEGQLQLLSHAEEIPGFDGGRRIPAAGTVIEVGGGMVKLRTATGEVATIQEERIVRVEK